MVSSSSLSRLSDALRERPADLSGLDAAALFTATCSTRFNKEQEALLGVQDKVLAGLRSVSSWLTPDLHRPVRAALLPLVTQPGFIKKRKGYRQHLVQALAEAASGPLPPSALLPILCAKETGPAAADLVLEVLERITGEEDNISGNDGNGSGGIGSSDESKKAVIELLHHVVAEVIKSGVTKSGKRGSVGPRAHLVSFLAQACSILPDYVLVFAKDLLVLAESRSSSARKLSLTVLAAVLKHDRGFKGRGTTPDPTLAAVLRFARSDGDATVRCSAFDSIAEYIGQMEMLSFDNHGDDCSSERDNYVPSDVAVCERSNIPTEEAGYKGSSSSGGDNSSVNLETGMGAMDIAPCNDSTPDHAGGETLVSAGKSRATPARPPAPSRRQVIVGRASRRQRGDGERPTTTTQGTSDRPSQREKGEGRAIGPWSVGGALLSSLSASADALSTDGSKAVRAKALACSLRILEVHGNTAVRSGGSFDGTTGVVEVPADSDCVAKTLCVVAKSGWGALEALAADSGGAAQASPGSVGGGRNRKAADAARDLLTLPCVNAVPIELVMCYERCRVAPGAGEGAAAAAEEAKRAVRQVTQARFCGDIGTLLRAVSDVMAADERRGRGSGDPNESAAGTNECASFSLSEVLCEVLAGVDGKVIAPLLRQALQAYAAHAAGDDVVQRHRKHELAVSAPVLLRTLALLAEANGNTKHAGEEKQSSGSNRADEEQIQILAGSQRLFWRSLERRMEDIERDSDEQAGFGAVHNCAPDAGLQESLVPCSSVGGGSGGSGSGSGRRDQRAMTVSDAVLELSELLHIYQLLATRSLISPENSLALEVLVYPAALTKRRLIRPAVALALALDEPHRVLLSSLAILQDAAFSRSSTDVGRACDYVRLIGVLATENASLIAAHVREQHEDAKDKKTRRNSRQEEEEGHAEDGREDYMAGVSNREAMEWDIRRLREASVTCDGMLSCYTPFLLAIVRGRIADSAAAKEQSRRQEGMLEESSFPPGGTATGINSCSGNGATRDGDESSSIDGGGDGNSGDSGGGGFSGNGNDDGGPKNAAGQVDEGNGGANIVRDEGCNLPGVVVPPPGLSSSSSSSSSSLPSSCPGALCAEALRALSEYAVLSPGLVAAEVLPLAEELAMDTLEDAQIRSAAVGVLTRRELATDETAAHVCRLLKDENPRIRREVLGRLGHLMKESRIQTVHLSRLALLLVDGCEKVCRTARQVFFDYLQPRPDEVNRCVFETYFTLDAEEPANRNILQNLVAVAREAAPGQGLEPLGGALVRKAAETGSSEAAFFLSLVPPTVNSLEAAEVALRRGQLAQAPAETVSLVAAHFSKGAQRRGSGIPSAGSSSSAWGRGDGSAPSKAQALEMAARIGSLNSRRRAAGRPSTFLRAAAEGKKTTPAARPRRGKKAEHVGVQSGGGGGGGGAEHRLTAAGDSREGSRDGRRLETHEVTPKQSGSLGLRKRRRARDASKSRGGDGGSSGGGALRTTGSVNENTRQRTSGTTVSVEKGEEEGEGEEEEEEEEWEG